VTVQLDGIAYRFVSADDHVQEHPTVWTDRLSRTRWGERVPHLEEEPDGSQTWVVDGRRTRLGSWPWRPVASREPDPVRRWEDLPAAAYDPARRLEAMDADGVDVSVLYPTVAGLAGETFGRITDPELELACVRAYNDWLVEEWASASPRFVPLCLVPLHPVEAAVAELERAVAAGHRGLVYPALPMFLRDVPELSEPDHGALFQACASLGVPVSFHSGCTPLIQAPPYDGFPSALAEAFEGVNRPFSSALVLANLLLSQMLVPHPELRVVLPEDSVGWGGFTLETMDYLVQVDRLNIDTYTLLPSEVFSRQCYFVGGYERLQPASEGLLPRGQVLWATSFPLATSTWPDTKQVLASSLEGVPDADRRRVLAENAAGLYRLEAQPSAEG